MLVAPFYFYFWYTKWGNSFHERNSRAAFSRTVLLTVTVRHHVKSTLYIANWKNGSSLKEKYNFIPRVSALLDSVLLALSYMVHNRSSCRPCSANIFLSVCVLLCLCFCSTTRLMNCCRNLSSPTRQVSSCTWCRLKFNAKDGDIEGSSAETERWWYWHDFAPFFLA